MKEEKQKIGFWKKFGRAFYPKSTEESIQSAIGKIEDIKSAFAKKEVREETFEQAKARLGVSDSDIKAVQKNYSIIAWMFVFFGMVCFVQAIYFLFFAHSITKALPGSVFTVFFSLVAFKYSFRVFQIKNKKLCSVKEFLYSGEFLPRTINIK